jgi:hypothetical protein
MELTLDIKKRYTYADYLTWMDNQACELPDGFIRLMSPAPTLTHAKILGKLFLSFGNYVLKNNGQSQVFTAPFDVRLPKKPEEMADNEIYKQIIPNDKLVLNQTEYFHFELYNYKFKWNNNESIIEIYVPLKGET